jgi:hypothetical protein
VALDAESRLVLSVVPGRQSAEHTLLLVQDVAARTGGAPLDLFTSDENPNYAWALLEVYGEWVQPERQGARGRHPNPVLVPPEDLTYATVHKTRENNRVVQVEARVVYGSAAAVQAALDKLGGEQFGPHGLHRAAQRHGPAPQRPQGAEDLLLLEGLGRA